MSKFFTLFDVKDERYVFVERKKKDGEHNRQMKRKIGGEERVYKIFFKVVFVVSSVFVVFFCLLKSTVWLQRWWLVFIETFSRVRLDSCRRKMYQMYQFQQ